WMSTTIYDEKYKDAPKRSLMRVFVKQTLIFINNVQDVIQSIKARKTTDMQARIKEIAAKTNKMFIKYQSYLEKKAARLAAANETRSTYQIRSPALEVSFDMLRSF